MAKRYLSFIAGLSLVALGGASLFGNALLGVDAWRLWPLTVILAGMAFTIPGFFALQHRGLGALLIPGLPVLSTGGILLAASLLGRWEIWALAWPLEIIALALGFALAAVLMRAGGLAIPAAILGANGLLLGYCTLTSRWGAWALLWPLEPLAIGLGLLVLAYAKRSPGAWLAGLVLTGIAGLGFFVTSFFSAIQDPLLRWAIPASLVFCGVVLIAAHWLQPADAGSVGVRALPEESA